VNKRKLLELRGGVEMSREIWISNKSLVAIKLSLVAFSVVALAIFISLLVPVFADTPSTVVVVPTITADGVDDQPFEATVTAGEGHTVHEFRVYESGDFDDLNCNAKTNWWGPVYSTNEFGYFCLWTAMDGYQIQPGNSDKFYFTMDSPDTECCRVMRTEPRDLEQMWSPKFTDICVDKTPPETTKHVSEPKKVIPGDDPEEFIEWIDSVTEITLTATDCPGGCDRDNGPHDAGIDKIWYMNVIDLTEEACWNPYEFCNPITTLYDVDGYPFPASPYEHSEGIGCINAMQEWCEDEGNWDGWMTSWYDCAEYWAHEECDVDPIWKLYRELGLSETICRKRS